MSKIDLTIHKEGLAHNIQKAKENNIIIPTIAQMQNPDLIPEKIKEKLTHTGLWDVDPVNLFRISWHNEAKESGGLYQKTPNYVEIPSSVSGVPCRILAMSGKWFPTGCHKAPFCLYRHPASDVFFIPAAIKIKATEVACIMKRLLLGLLIDCWL